LSGIIFHPFGFAAVFIFVIIAGLHEFYGMLLPSSFPLRKYLGYLTAAILFLLFYAKGFGAISANCFWILTVPVAALFAAELYSKSATPFLSIAYVLSGVLYIAMPFALVNTLTFNSGNYDYHLLLTLFIFLWSNDVGAYCFGMMLGRKGKHKLFERISPKKSWEGFWGGIIAVLLAGFILSYVWGERYIGANHPFEQGMNLIQWYILAVIVSIFATFGDLTESMLKRSVGAKDSGKIMPGHGGILDRFDGALIAFPCALAYIHIFNIL
jgi:phosphatidate cytidylyltransferase